MNRLARRITDKAVLRLIRRYLDAGVLAQGVARFQRISAGWPRMLPCSTAACR
jgi:hypothetical protein